MECGGKLSTGYCHSTVTNYCWDLPAGSTPMQCTDSGCYFTATGATVFQTYLRIVFQASSYSAAPSESTHVHNLLTGFLLKAVPKGTKKEGEIFTIRNVDPARISTCCDFKGVIRHQLIEEVTRSDFEIGFLHGTNVIRVRNQEDLSELWSDLKKSGSNVTVWCDGLRRKAHLAENMFATRTSKQR